MTIVKDRELIEKTNELWKDLFRNIIHSGVEFRITASSVEKEDGTWVYERYETNSKAKE